MNNIFDAVLRGSATAGTHASHYWTKGAVAAIGKAKDRADALLSLARNHDALLAKGVDVQAVENQIDREFPEHGKHLVRS